MKLEARVGSARPASSISSLLRAIGRYTLSWYMATDTASPHRTISARAVGNFGATLHQPFTFQTYHSMHIQQGHRHRRFWICQGQASTKDLRCHEDHTSGKE